MVLRIDLRGNILSVGKIESGLFIGCNDNSCSLVIPLDVYGTVVGIDEFGNLFVNGEGVLDYYEYGYRAGKLYKIGYTTLDYYEYGCREGKPSRIGYSTLDYYEYGYRAGKLSRV